MTRPPRTDPFPSTTWTVVRDATGPDPVVREEAWRRLIEAYRSPIEAIIRRHVWRRNACEEVVNDFWTYLCTENVLPRIDPRRSFRAYIQVVARNYARHAMKARGIGLDEDVVGGDSPTIVEDMEEAAWAEGILAMAIDQLLAERPRDGRILLGRYGIGHREAPAGEASSYERLAHEFELSPEALRQALCRARRTLREAIGDVLRESVASDEELVDEEELLARLLASHPGIADPDAE